MTNKNKPRLPILDIFLKIDQNILFYFYELSYNIQSSIYLSTTNKTIPRFKLPTF